MDSRIVNFSIKKSQIHTHKLGLSQKLTKLDIAWKDKCCMGFWVWFPKNGSKWAFVYIFICIYCRSATWWPLVKQGSWHKFYIKITLAMANGLEPPARMIIVSANEADKALSGALLTCEWSRFSAFPLTPDPTQPTGQQLNLLFKSRLFPIN